MSKIKIISNPYLKETIIQKWDFVNDSWETLTYENSSQSSLISEDIKTGFFQFKVDEIVAGIYEDYHNSDEKISITFEGTEDDFIVLSKVCNREEYINSINLIQAEKHLENASDILPSVKKIFTQLEPLIEYCVTDKESVSKDMAKFSEASADYIPIVIMGNYSSGKSTFINSLLGNEILPSGEEPVTAKIYKISKSESDDRATLSFYFHDVERVDVKFTTKKYTITCEHENTIVKLLKESLEEVKSESITTRLGRALLTINSYENDTDDKEISDLIEVTTPFNNGLLADSSSQYVIFDTPGSNSASNARHLDVLERAMKDMSNGVALFVAGFDSLDSTDNENLFKRIKNMPELDNRFTMIIVNKADNSSLPSEGFSEQRVKYILNESVPKNLYSQGIFFVSSIMGLGSKLEEELEDEHYSEIFDTQYRNYSDPKSRHYKTLYKYNIMPGQAKIDSTEKAQACENLIYANSGVYSVEMGLEAFAKKYSPYNKCEQSRLFLMNTIETTEKVIAERVAKSKQDKENLTQSLEKEKKELLELINERSSILDEQFTKKYSTFISKYMDQKWRLVTLEDLKIQQKHIEERYQSEMNLEGVDAKVRDSKATIAEDFKAGMKKEANSRNIENLGKNIISGFKELQEHRAELKNTNKAIDDKVSDELVDLNKANFIKNANIKKAEIDAKSKALWTKNAQQVREELSAIIAGSSALTSEQRDVLSNIIIQYGDIQFDNKADEIFIKDDFIFGIKLGSFVLGDSGKIWLDKLRRVFNAELTKYIHNVCRQIQENHATSFKKWLSELLSDITANITEYSSMLRTQLDYIRKEEETIIDFESKHQQIKNYSAAIEEMINWKE